MTYLQREGESDAYKIGYSLDPGRRRAHLQTGNSQRLTTVLAVPGGRFLENFMHAWFADRKTADGGGTEFFSFPEGMPEARRLFLEAGDKYEALHQDNPDLRGNMLARIALALP